MPKIQWLSLVACTTVLLLFSGCTTINVNDVPAVVEEMGNVATKVCFADRNPLNPECLIVTEKQRDGEVFIGRIDARAEKLFAEGRPVLLLMVEKDNYLCTSPIFYCFKVEKR